MSFIQNAMQVRVYCTLHSKPATNIGSGVITYPTNGLEDLEPHVTEDGWMTLDASEYACPEWNDDSECELEFQIITD